MNKWIAEFDLEEGCTMPEHMDLNYMGANIDFHCRPMWIPVSERLPETDNKNEINNYNVLLWVKNKNYPEREPQIYLGKLRYINGDDGSGNFWGIETKPCNWTIWGWCYFNEPDVLAWMPLPEPYKAESEV